MILLSDWAYLDFKLKFLENVKKYISLNERTKTLANLKKEDSTANREEAAPYIKRYEDPRERIRNQKSNTNEDL